jgi:hypothetical protein
MHMVRFSGLRMYIYVEKPVNSDSIALSKNISGCVYPQPSFDERAYDGVAHGNDEKASDRSEAFFVRSLIRRADVTGLMQSHLTRAREACAAPPPEPLF